MQTPWLWVQRFSDPNELAVPGSEEYEWHALFACQVLVPDFKSWDSMKWGFNSEALFREAMERQHRFLQGQHSINLDLRMEYPERRTLALRLLRQPEQGVLCALVGKICGRSEWEARESAQGYLRSLRANFPYEYGLKPALSEPEFRKLCGWELLQAERGTDIAQILRYEMPVSLDRRSGFLQGHWKAGEHGHEPIWRSVASWPCPLMINFLLRSTVLYEPEAQLLERHMGRMASTELPATDARFKADYEKWHREMIGRLQSPGQRLFYLQVHIVSNGAVDEHLARTVGNALTTYTPGEDVPGYQVRHAQAEELGDWALKLRNLDVILAGSLLPAVRLSEVADLDEVAAALRFPYQPPPSGFPGVRFAGSDPEQDAS